MLSSYSVGFRFCALFGEGKPARRGGESMKKLKEIMGSNAFQNVVIALCVIAMGLSLVSIVHSARAMMAIDREISEAKAAAAAAPTPTPTPAPTPAPTPTPSPKPAQEDYAPPEDLAEQQERNAHVIAMFDIPGTDTRYPILLHPTEDNYYLDVTIDGDYGLPGSLYVNSMEGKDFDTFNTVIYGHNMANETYFGSLKYYNDESFRDAHREIDIYTPTKALRYDVFAVVTYDDRYITDRYRDEKREDRMAFLRSLLDFSPVVYDDVSVGPDSHILTLSTCIGGMPNNRLLILAVLREPAASPAPAPAALPDKGEAGKIRKN